MVATTGAVALVGSGEYTAAMNETDAALLATVGGADSAKVALLPTASGLEGDRPAWWNRMGVEHFTALGVRDVRPTQIVDAASAADPVQVDLLRDANFFYFSGGNPQHVVEAMRGSPAWDAIAQALAGGAAIGGCSAGAMMMGGHSLSVRLAFASGQVSWSEALGVVPGVIVFPHFDRMSGFVTGDAFLDILRQLPEDTLALGIDEDTALVRLDPSRPQHWQVMGRQGVTLFTREGKQRTLRAGEVAELPSSPPRPPSRGNGGMWS